MEVEPLIALMLALIFAALFFVSDYFEQKFPLLHISFIAGISLGYFFLVVLPEIQARLPEFPLHLTILEYLFVLIGFSFIHTSEKFILQRVEAKSQKELRELLFKEKNLEAVERNMENLVSEEITHEDMDILALKDMARIMRSLHEQSVYLENQIESKKQKVHDHINKDLEELRFFTNYSYHLLIGLILFNLLLIDFISGILFFVFAFFRAIVSNRLHSQYKMFTDLDIQVDYQHPKKLKFILGTSALTGVMIGLLFFEFFSLNLEMVYILYSFISGVILYTIVREVIPEKEKGKPVYFIIGLTIFIILIILLNTFRAFV
jgi:zinc transporter ZupT